jgi:hypothetical protein
MKPIAIAAVFASMIAGLVMVGPPSEARARKLDDRRVEDLRSLAGAVDLYWSRRGALPASLQEATREQRDSSPVGDPLTGHPYSYRVISVDSYELCADFQRASEREGRAWGIWSHGRGRRCFERNLRLRSLQ